jgi:hypothetical protein
MSKRLLAALLVLAWMSCCGINAAEEKDRQAVQHTVLRYAQLLAEGYSKMNMTSLQAVATEEQAVKAYRHMSALGEAKIRMESSLEDIEFTDIQLSDKDEARVKTREKWNYMHIGTDPKMPRQTVVEDLIYELSYDLVRRDGKWIVSSVSVLAEDKSGDLATINSTRHKRPRPEDVVLSLRPKEPQVLSLIEAFSGVLE